MPRVKGSMLQIMPLCLKIRGQIVGAVARTRIGIYLGAGLLLLVSLLLMILFSDIQYDSGTVVRKEETAEQPVAVPLESKEEVIPMAPKPMTKKESLVITAALKAPIQVDFGWQFHPLYQDWRYHTGIDISGSMGQTVQAIEEGQVLDIMQDPQSGLTLIVKNNQSTIYYGSLGKVMVEKESRITAGQVIGTMGNCEAEPYVHLHLAIKVNEQYIDPKTILYTPKKENQK